MGFEQSSISVVCATLGNRVCEFLVPVLNAVHQSRRNLSYLRWLFLNYQLLSRLAGSRFAGR